MLIAGGGTGGHLFPGLALAEELVREHAAEVRFIGSRHGIERTAVARAGFTVELLPVRGVMGEGLRGLARTIVRVPQSVVAALRVLRDFRPALVVGVGGYASFPALAAAVIGRRPIVLLEQNARPGLVTRLFAPFARRVCVSFAETSRQLRGTSVVTGNPVRWRPAADGAESRRESREPFRVLVFGGSAGAHRLNAVAPGALARLTGPLSVVHQTGSADREAVAERYRALGIDARVPSFIDDMEAAYRATDLVICRAGATTIAELTALGVAAVLVPYPFAAGDHQRRNAESLVRAGAAWMIEESELDEESLATVVQAARDDPAALADRQASARALGRPDAAARVVQECLAVIAAHSGAARGG